MLKTYSTELNKLFDTKEEAEQEEAKAVEAKKKAEEEKEKLLAERKARADEVTEARKKMIEAQKEYEKVMSDFLRDYKTYHYSTNSLDEIPRLFDFNWPWRF